MRIGSPAFHSYNRTLRRIYMVELVDAELRRLRPDRRRPPLNDAPGEAAKKPASDGQSRPTAKPAGTT